MKYPGWELIYRWSVLVLAYACGNIALDTHPGSYANTSSRVFLAIAFTAGIVASFRICAAGRHPNE